jgi:K+-sensing histidine kinase KdpD
MSTCQLSRAAGPQRREEPLTEGAPGATVGTSGAEGAGHFRVYLAAAPGAGKTIAMLDEGRRLRAQATDVVIAFIEDHDRPVTQAHAAGLEVVPRRTWEYRGARFEEMDVDGVLRRSPDGLAGLRTLVADVGATWHDLDADDLASALVEYAKNEQVTQIVVGSSQRSRWQELTGGSSIAGRVSRLAARAGIDVHIVALHEVGVGSGRR